MRLAILMDNYVINRSYNLGEPAFSAWIEAGDRKVLFDFGETGAYLLNAARQGLDLGRLDLAVVSHGHGDHTNGIGAWLEAFGQASRFRRPLLVHHPDAFLPKNLDDVDIGCSVDPSDMAKGFELKPAKEPLDLGGGLLFLGQIERTNIFEAQEALGERLGPNGWEPDLLLDDSALVSVGKDRIDIITGCSHSGVCNIIEYARKVTGIGRVGFVLGGFHLDKSRPALVQATCDYFSRAGVESVYACHCTDTWAKLALSRVCDVEEAGVGLVLET